MEKSGEAKALEQRDLYLDGVRFLLQRVTATDPEVMGEELAGMAADVVRHGMKAEGWLSWVHEENGDCHARICFLLIPEFGVALYERGGLKIGPWTVARSPEEAWRHLMTDLG